jgi:hypothetical protein
MARAPHQRLSLGAPANGLQHLHHKSELDGDGGVVRAIEALGDAKGLAKFASLETLICGSDQENSGCHDSLVTSGKTTIDDLQAHRDLPLLVGDEVRSF